MWINEYYNNKIEMKKNINNLLMQIYQPIAAFLIIAGIIIAALSTYLIKDRDIFWQTLSELGTMIATLMFATWIFIQEFNKKSKK